MLHVYRERVTIQYITQHIKMLGYLCRAQILFYDNSVLSTEQTRALPDTKD
jgi:hypothetical protein